MMRCTGAMVTTTTATGCGWSFPGAEGAPEAVSAGSAVLLEADTDLHPGAPSTGWWCQVGIPVHVGVVCLLSCLLRAVVPPSFMQAVDAGPYTSN